MAANRLIDGQQDGRETAILRVRVTPRAHREEILLDDAGEIRVKLKALPTRGQANAALIKLFARTLGVPSRDVEIASGATSRRKTVRVRNLAAQEVWSRLKQASG
jgi:uncharacterized protein (TIGR00251 family)